MINKKFFNHHKLRTAKICISTSSMRSQGKAGLIKSIREFIYKDLSLDAFSKSLKRGKYKEFLDKTTIELCKASKNKGCKWGSARKALNLYFRDVLYNTYLFKSLGLKTKYGWSLEIPLDSKTMSAIRTAIRTEKKLSKDVFKLKVSTIIALDSETSSEYHKAAHLIAKKLYPGYTRVDLDMKFWAE